MDIKEIAKWTVAALTIAVIQFAQADSAVRATDTIRLYRVTYDGSTAMPDHLAYLSLMQNMKRAELEAGTGTNIEHIKAHLSLDDDAAEAFRQFVLASYEEMTDTNTEVTSRMLCANNRARYAFSEAHAVLDVLDDIKETNLRKQLRRALVNVGRSHSAELEAWLGQIRAGDTDHRYDHYASLDYDRFSVEEVVTTACNFIASSD